VGHQQSEEIQVPRGDRLEWGRLVVFAERNERASATCEQESCDRGIVAEQCQAERRVAFGVDEPLIGARFQQHFHGATRSGTNRGVQGSRPFAIALIEADASGAQERQCLDVVACAGVVQKYRVI
jgi:hypothetical protein